MNNKEPKILIIILIIAGAILALIYIKENPNIDKYTSGYSGVNFSKQFGKLNAFDKKTSSFILSIFPEIANTNVKISNIDLNYQSNTGKTNIKQKSPLSTKSSLYHDYKSEYQSRNSGTTLTSKNNFSGSNANTYTAFNTIQDINSGSNDGLLISLSENNTIFRKDKSASTISNSNNIASIDIDLSSYNDVSLASGAASGLNDITDPGDDPTGPPIPVPDGLWVLLGFLSLYTISKIITHRLIKKSGV